MHFLFWKNIQLIVMFQLFLKTYIRPFMLTIVSIASQRLMKFSDKMVTRFTVFTTHSYTKVTLNIIIIIYVCGKPYEAVFTFLSMELVFLFIYDRSLQHK